MKKNQQKQEICIQIQLYIWKHLSHGVKTDLSLTDQDDHLKIKTGDEKSTSTPGRDPGCLP